MRTPADTERARGARPPRLTAARTLAFGLVLLLESCSGSTPTPAADVPVRIVRQGGRWTGFAVSGPLDARKRTIYVISGELRNDGVRSIAAVKLVYELLDDLDTVVASEYGYNHRAEDLRLPDYEAGRIPRADLHLQPLAANDTDMFRMVFIRSQIPPFHHWRVRIVGVEYD